MHTKLATSLHLAFAPICEMATCQNKALSDCSLCWQQTCISAHIRAEPRRAYSCFGRRCHRCNPHFAGIDASSRQCRVCGFPHATHYRKDCEARLQDCSSPALAIERGPRIESNLGKPMPLDTLKTLFKVDTAYHGKRPSPNVSTMAGVASSAPGQHITTATNHTSRLRRKTAFSRP